MGTKVSLEELTRPAVTGAAAVAIRLVDDLAPQRDRLADPADAEALHDFRVALRRLRSWLRAFRPWLDDHVPGRIRRRLSRIADASNVSRDAEVQLEWLHAQRDALGPDGQAALDWLAARLEARRRDADESLHIRVARDFDRTCDALRASGSGAAADVAAGPDVETVAAAAAENVRRHVESLRRHLAAVHSIADQEEAHEARIEGKRLRYLLEPFAEHVEGGGRLVSALKEFQDVAGELHDAHVLLGEIADVITEVAAERARRITSAILHDAAGTGEIIEPRDLEHGFVALARRVRRRQVDCFAALSEQWLSGGADALLGELLVVGARLEALGAVPIGAAPAGVEIERKFLLRALLTETTGAPVVEIEQGYLPGTRLAERLRRTMDASGERWYRTVKLGAGLVRTEIEEETTREVFAAMWPLTEGRRVRKLRYRIADGALTWEIDEFLDRRLVLAEVELDRADSTAEPPAWLAPHVEREVTAEEEFSNRNLAR